MGQFERVTIERPQRPRELQDGLNHYFYHPLAWQLARALSHTPLTPNMVSVFGALMVIMAGAAYVGLDWPVSAALGMALHMSWHIVDGADGDLARLTGRASPIGEMVDGICDYGSHIVLYLTLGWFLHDQIGWVWANVWMWAAGLSHIVQANHVEVQRRSYQWWFYDKPWLRNSHKEEGSKTRSKGLGSLAAAYLTVASGVTPINAELDELKEEVSNDPARLAKFRAAVRAEIPRLSSVWRVLGPNPRAIILGLSMFAGSPLYYFVIYAVLMNLLLVISVKMHNAAWRRVAETMKQA